MVSFRADDRCQLDDAFGPALIVYKIRTGVSDLCQLKVLDFLVLGVGNAVAVVMFSGSWTSLLEH